ncbi:hypothetical protein WA026_012744 [Henosepilachna vigintioctopunctata]|uniref:Uncharacterized protein n=1 Tax=Henosepilachna vigintioctopunctata TaxID=420089 RepID=A0AAW1TXV7_9CUCU
MDSLYKTCKNNPRNDDLNQDYKRYRNLLHALIKEAKFDFFKRKIDQNASDGKSVWKIIKTLNENSGEERKEIHIRDKDTNTIVQSQLETANLFNKFFSFVG